MLSHLRRSLVTEQVPTGDIAVFAFLEIVALAFAFEGTSALLNERPLGIVISAYVAAVVFFIAGVKWPKTKRRILLAWSKSGTKVKVAFCCLSGAATCLLVLALIHFYPSSHPANARVAVPGNNPDDQSLRFSATFTFVTFHRTLSQPPMTPFMILLWVSSPGQPGMNILYPVDILMTIRLANTSSRPFVVEHYDVEFLLADGRWMKLCRLDALHYRVFGLDPGIKQAEEVDTNVCSLDKALSEKVLKWDEKPAEGVAFFEIAKGSISDYTNVATARITISTADNINLTSEGPINTPPSLNSKGIVFKAERYNLTGLRRLNHAPICFWQQ